MQPKGKSYPIYRCLFATICLLFLGSVFIAVFTHNQYNYSVFSLMKYTPYTANRILDNEYPFTLLSIEERIAYYLPDTWMVNETVATQVVRDTEVNAYTQKFDRLMHVTNRTFAGHPVVGKHGLLISYWGEAWQLLSYADHCSYFAQLGDGVLQSPQLPVYMKARVVGTQNVVLMKFEADRHFGNLEIVDAYDIPFAHKNSKVLWRGSDTGQVRGERRATVTKYFRYRRSRGSRAIDPHSNATTATAATAATATAPIDIAFLSLSGLAMVRPHITKQHMLRSKYLVTIPGNDIASNLGWVLYSNSVPFAYHPSTITTETWMMQGLLEPYVHYVPFNEKSPDYNDSDTNNMSLLQAFAFCESNQDKCAQIAQNGKRWMMQFQNEERETRIKRAIHKRYCQRMQNLTWLP